VSAPLIWIILPLAISAILLALLKYDRVIRWMGLLTSGLLSLIAFFQPVGSVLQIGGISIDFTSSFYIFGRSFSLDNSDRFVILIVYMTIFFFLLLMDREFVPTKFVPLSFAIAAFLLSALAVQPFLYSAVLVELAVLLMILMVREKGDQPVVGILRFLIYLSLALPCILFAGWILGGAQASTSDETRLTAAAIFLLVGFSIWLAVFPFHSWLPQFAATVHPFLFGFLFSILPVVLLLVIVDYLSSLIWLRSATYLSPALMTIGAIMVVTAGIFSSVEKQIARLASYTVLLETGFALFMIALRSDQGMSLLYQSFIPRIIGLSLLCYSLSILRQNQISLVKGGVTSLIRQFPFATLGILGSMLSIAGFPLLAAFPVRLQLLHLIGRTSLPALIALAAGMAGFLIATVRLFVLMTFPARQKWHLRERPPQVIVLCIGLLLLVVMGLFPSIPADMISLLAIDLPILW